MDPQCHNAEQLYVWLLHFIANNYLIFSHKPDFLELSGQCLIVFITSDDFKLALKVMTVQTKAAELNGSDFIFSARGLFQLSMCRLRLSHVSTL